MTPHKLLSLQKEYFNSNITKNVRFRISQLKKFKNILQENEIELYAAIEADFSKSEFETYATELSLIYHEINTFIRKTKKWGKKRRVNSGIANFPSKSYIMPEPLGVILVIGAWNYPYQLSLLPALTAIAAGNTVILKPSELPAETSRIMARLINDNFDKAFFHVIEGGVDITTTLINLPVDKIFFTGSIPVGKIVYQAAAKNLIPVTLELGGKSPTFVLPDAPLKQAAKRIIWAKFLNAGQTCIAPDYILVHKSIEKEFLAALKLEIEQTFSNENSSAENYVQIINQRNFDRLKKLIDSEKLYFGGQLEVDNRYIAPTIIQNVSFDDVIMQDEIFGPILPVISFTELDDAILQVKTRPKPLSLYLYSKSKTDINKILNSLSFGGGAVNDSVMHIANSKLPFGGVGASGMGAYHGKTGFDTFTHYKSILHKKFWYELPVKYPPYSKTKLKLVKWFMG